MKYDVKPMTAGDRAVIRSALDHALVELVEARQVREWWATLGPDVRRQYQEFEALLGRLRLSVAEAAAVLDPD
jgi:hypothetical protein